MVLVACGNGQSRTSGPSDQQGFAPDQRYTAYFSRLDQRARFVVRDARAWAAFWDQLYQNQTARPALPAVDFAQQMVVVAAMGTQNTGGYSIAVEQVSFGSEVLVDVLERSPGRTCGVSQVLTQPVDAVVVPSSAAPVRFQETAAVYDC